MSPIVAIAHRPETPKPDPPIPNEPDNGEGDVYEQNTRLTTGDDTFSSCSFSYESLSLGTWAYEF
ncbi:hypothetical protein LB506_004465 [Fusarium annulatum]|nr:hypothetical protein LB506_004465 [Fusarium annulatum]